MSRAHTSTGARRSVLPTAFDPTALLDIGKSKSTNPGSQGILTPISNIKFAQKDQIEKVKVQNMRAQVDEGAKVVTMRCITPMDKEPMHLLQAL